MIEALTTALQLSPSSALWVLLLIGTAGLSWQTSRAAMRIRHLEGEYQEMKEIMARLDQKLDQQTAQIARLEARINGGLPRMPER